MTSGLPLITSCETENQFRRRPLIRVGRNKSGRHREPARAHQGAGVRKCLEPERNYPVESFV